MKWRIIMMMETFVCQTLFAMDPVVHKDPQSTLFSQCVARMVEWSPPRRPVSWIGLNVFVTAASIVQLALLLFSDNNNSNNENEDIKWPSLATATFWFVNHIPTTVLWCLQVALTVLERRWISQPLRNAILGEFIVVLLLLSCEATRWVLPSSQQETACRVVHASLATIAFGYATWQCSQWHQQRRAHGLANDVEQGQYESLEHDLSPNSSSSGSCSGSSTADDSAIEYMPEVVTE